MIIESAPARDIRELADVFCDNTAQHCPMRIGISIESNDPICGEVGKDHDEAVRFAGWLDLIRVLAEIIESPAGAPAVSLPPPAGLVKRVQA